MYQEFTENFTAIAREIGNAAAEQDLEDRGCRGCGIEPEDIYRGEE